MKMTTLIQYRSALVTVSVGILISSLVVFDFWIDGCVSELLSGVVLCEAEARSVVNELIAVISTGSLLLATIVIARKRL